MLVSIGTGDDMTISWRGLGFLGFIVPLAFLALATLLGSGVNDFGAIRITMVLAAIVVWIVGVRLNGDELEADGKAKHLAFGFPMQWSALLAVAGLFLTFA
jgi:uncharacterized membrane protein